MPQPCTICGHPERRMLNFLLAAKRPLRRVARQYGVSKSALSRHWAQHRQAASAEAMDMARTMTALNSQLEDLLQEVRQARGRAPQRPHQPQALDTPCPLGRDRVPLLPASPGGNSMNLLHRRGGPI